MKPNYYEIMYDDFLQLTEDSPMELTIQKMYRDGCFTSDINDVLRGDKDPVILLVFSYEYVIDGSVTTYELKDSTGKTTVKEIEDGRESPLKASMLVVMATRDMNKNQILEDYFVSKYKNERIIRVPYPYDENVFLEISIKLDENEKIARTKGDNRLVSSIQIECKDCILYEDSYSPVEVAFDELKQDEVLRRIDGLYKISKHYNDVALGDKVIGQDIDIYRDKSKRISQLADELIKNTEIMSDDYADQYYFGLIFEKYSKDPQRDLKNAIKKLESRKDIIDKDKENYYKELDLKIQKKEEVEKNRIEKEQNRIKAMELNKIKFQSHGDIMENLFTDAVIRDIKSKLSNEISIYGGTSYMEYFKNKQEGTLKYPSILVETNVDFDANLKSYVITKQDGRNENRYYDFIRSLPFGYGITLHIKYKKDTMEHAAKIRDYLRRIYANPVVLYVNNPMEAGTYLPITLCIDASAVQNTPVSNSNDLFNAVLGSFKEDSYNISFIKYCNVYYSYKLTKEEIQGNPRGQIVLLKQLLYAKDIINQLDNILSKELPDGYKPLITGQNTPTGYYGNSAYWKLRRKNANKYPIDRQLYEEAFKTIVDRYPAFYDKIMAGWVYNQIEQDIIKLRDVFVKKCSDLYYMLDVPEKNIMLAVFKMDQPDYKSDEAIKYYIEKISSDNLDITEAIREYSNYIMNEKDRKDKQEKKSIQSEKEIAERAYYQSQYDDRSYDGDDSSGGLISGALSLAGKVIEHKYEKYYEKNKKIDYRGSSSCQIGKPNNGLLKGTYHINCTGCPIRSQCAGYR